MQLDNPTPFPAFAFACIDQHDELFRVVAVRISLSWALRAGERSSEYQLVWAEEQMPLLLHDTWYGDPTSSCLEFESDLAPYKPKCDLVLHGDAHAPRGRPAERWTVAVGVSVPRVPREPLTIWSPDHPMAPIHDKRLIVTGPRRWEHDPKRGWQLSQPAPTLTVPLTYEHAYGGEHLPDPSDLEEHLACPTNTIGCGYFPEDAPDGLRRRLEAAGSFPAPRLERPDDPIADVHRAHALEGFGFVSKHWQPRLALAGTYDDAWLKARWPWLPGDFQFAYWNGAHPDLQVPHLLGGETVTLTNLTPFDLPGSRHSDAGQTVVVRVPENQVFLRARTKGGKRTRIGLPIDTLVIDAARMLAWATYRTAFSEEEGIASASLDVETPEMYANLHSPRGGASP